MKPPTSLVCDPGRTSSTLTHGRGNRPEGLGANKKALPVRREAGDGSQADPQQIRRDTGSAGVTASRRYRCLLAVLRGELTGPHRRKLLHVLTLAHLEDPNLEA